MHVVPAACVASLRLMRSWPSQRVVVWSSFKMLANVPSCNASGRCVRSASLALWCACENDCCYRAGLAGGGTWGCQPALNNTE